MTLREKIAILQAVERGEKTQVRNKPGSRALLQGIGWRNAPDWEDMDNIGENSFNFALFDYRVKPSLMIAGYEAEPLRGGLKVGCTFVSREDIRKAYEATTL